MSASSVIDLVTSVGVDGVVLLLIWHLVTKRIPKSQDDHSRALADQAKAFQVSLDKHVEAFRTEMQLERESHDRHVQRLLDMIPVSKQRLG